MTQIEQPNNEDTVGKANQADEVSIEEDIQMLQEMQVNHARMIAKLTQRINKLEKLAFTSTLDMESELSEMERILTGLDPEPDGASKRRAVGIGRLWTSTAQTTLEGEVLNVMNRRLKPLLSQEMGEKLSNKQVTRAMKAFVDMMISGGKHQAEMMKGSNGANQLVVPVPSDVCWTTEDLRDRLDESS